MSHYFSFTFYFLTIYYVAFLEYNTIFCKFYHRESCEYKFHKDCRSPENCKAPRSKLNFKIHSIFTLQCLLRCINTINTVIYYPFHFIAYANTVPYLMSLNSRQNLQRKQTVYHQHNLCIDSYFITNEFTRKKSTKNSSTMDKKNNRLA